MAALLLVTVLFIAACGTGVSTPTLPTQVAPTATPTATLAQTPLSVPTTTPTPTAPPAPALPRLEAEPTPVKEQRAVSRGPDVVFTIAYGPGSKHVGDLRLPITAIVEAQPGMAEVMEGPEQRVPVVVLLHGGFWRQSFERDLMDALARDLTERGFATWNVEYRGIVGDAPAGSWPDTGRDVDAAINHLALLSDDLGLDLERLGVIGHSAGGQLALWAAARHQLREGWHDDADDRYPSDGLLVPIAAAVSLAGVVDLADAAIRNLGLGAVQTFLGPDYQALFAHASPIELLPSGVPTLLVHGGTDLIVPLAQSERYERAARRAGDDVELAVVPGVGHFEVIDPASDAWQQAANWLVAQLTP